jgi:hypothetical protein
MENVDAKTIMARFHKILIPFLDRLEALEPGSRDLLLRNYLLHLSTTSLHLPTVFMKESFGDAAFPANFGNLDDCIATGVDCIYAYDGDEDEVSFH